VSFDHKGETPGLGARITSLEIQQRYKGKRLFDESGAFAVQMLKGESNGVENHPHHVDGMSGATITGNGVNDMMKAYVGHYKAFLDGLASSAQAAL
jgi:Na+-transporting NADH:ubiquinone oxidoreductase subunit C